MVLGTGRIICFAHSGPEGYNISLNRFINFGNSLLKKVPIFRQNPESMLHARKQPIRSMAIPSGIARAKASKVCESRRSNFLMSRNPGANKIKPPNKVLFVVGTNCCVRNIFCQSGPEYENSLEPVIKIKNIPASTNSQVAVL